MYPRSQPDQSSATLSRDADNIRARLGEVESMVSSIHGHLDGLIEGIFGPRPQEAKNPTGVVPGTPQYRHILDSIDYRLREIERGLEFLSARL